MSYRCRAKAASCDTTIFVMKADGSGQRRLTHTPGDGSPAWSPRGDLIAFVRPVRGNNVDSYEIFVMNIDGSDVRRLTRNGVVDSSPTWSPDGRRIAFTRWPGNGSDGTSAIYVMNADGTGQRRIVPQPGRPLFSRRENWSPVWSPVP